MHKNFAEWLNITNPNPSEELIQKRSDAITAFLADVNTENALELIRLFFKKNVKSQATRESFIKYFTDQDASFLKKDTDIQVLAGITIAEIIENKAGSLADTVALAISCISFQELATDVLIPDILLECKNYLHQRSDTLRNTLTIPAITPVKVVYETKALDKKIAETPSSFQEHIAEIIKALPKIGSASEVAITGLANQISMTINNLTRSLDLQREETNMLWWVFGGYSEDLDRPFNGMGSATAIIGAKELAGLTKVIPGPVSSKALLRKVLDVAGFPEEISVKDTLNACEKDWRNAWIGQRDIKRLDDFCVIHYAAQIFNELDKESSWVDFFNKQSPLKAEDNTEALRLSLQTYREACLLKALGI